MVHMGNQQYARYVTEKAAESNTVYVIGDKSNQELDRITNVEWCDAESLISEQLQHFREIYVHMSSNDYDYERICFERHFLVYNLAQKLHISQLAMIDSDLLIYGRVNDLLAGIQEDFDAALCWNDKQGPMAWSASPHFSVWTIEALEDFISYTNSLYSDPEKLKEKWTWHQENHMPGGICDMTALFLWKSGNRTAKRIVNLTPYENPWGFDYNIQQAAEICPYRKIGRIEDIQFQEGIPMFFLSSSGEPVHALTIHAQADAKRYIGMFYHGRNGAMERLFLDIIGYFYKFRLILNRIFRQIRNR